jgi:hypothetical protein
MVSTNPSRDPMRSESKGAEHIEAMATKDNKSALIGKYATSHAMRTAHERNKKTVDKRYEPQTTTSKRHQNTTKRQHAVVRFSPLAYHPY